MNGQPTLDETRALLIEMRHYAMRKGLLIGECVAWNKLKELHGVGQDDEADLAWLREYLARPGSLPSTVSIVEVARG